MVVQHIVLNSGSGENRTSGFWTCPGFAGASSPHIEEWLVPADQAAKLSIDRRLRVTLELLEDDQT
jgi:hypothetical protein